MPRSEAAALAAGRGVHLGQLTQVLANRYDDRVAVEDDGRTPGLDHGERRTFRDIEEAVARFAAALQREGVQADERVVIAIGNRIDVVTWVCATARLGAVPVPVNARLREKEIAAIIEATRASVAVLDDDVRDRFPDELTTLPVSRLAEQIAASPDRVDEPPVALDPDATAVLLTTSGTTGLPKAAALTSRGLLSSLGRLVLAPVGRDRGLRARRDLVLACLPLTHVMGLAVTLGTLCAGVPLLRRDHFDAEVVLDLIEDRKPNVLIAVPTMYADLESVGAADRDLSSIQVFISSADVLPPDRARRFQGYGAALRVRKKGVGRALFIDIYGMVELSGGAAVRLFLPSLIGKVQAPSFALTLPGMQIRAVDEDGNPVPTGKVGELQFRGTGVLEGYEGQDDVKTEDGWFATGDHGRVWRGGFFQFAGRSKDRLKVGGFSVFPAEVETELREGPGVKDVALVGVPDERLGDRPVAVVVPAADFDEDAFLAWAAQAVAGYRRPTAVVRIDVLPRGNNGKIDRQTATQIAVDALD